METEESWDVPVPGAAVERERLLAALLGQQVGLTVIAAPAGHGKTVLASQFARAGVFQSVVWVSVFDEDTCGERLAMALARAIARHAGKPLQAASTEHLSTADALLLIGGALQGRQGDRMCVVIDGCNRVERVSCLEECSRLIRTLTSPASALVLTCRSIDNECLDPGLSCAIDAKDLRFTAGEVSLLAQLSGEQSHVEQVTTRLMNRFGGHPALTSLMLRHRGLDDEVTPPRDLVWYSDRLISRTSQCCLRILYVAALLKEDDIACLSSLSGIELDEVPWDEIRSLSPLVLLEESSSRTSFRVRLHAVMQDSVLRSAHAELLPDETDRLRQRVLRHLEAQGGYERIQSVLQNVCPEAEVVSWSERHGYTLLRMMGVEAVIRVMNRVSPRALCSNPRLLLLRSSILAERESYEEARSCATLAANLAEAAGEGEVAARALLAVARLDVDMCDYQSAIQLLRKLDRSAGLPLVLEQLAEAQLAALETQMGDTEAAIRRADRLLSSIDTRDMSSEETVVIYNALAAVKGLCAGRWDEAAMLLSRLASRHDLAPSKRTLIRANLAVCQMELASLREAEETLNAVLEDAEIGGLRQLTAFAMGTRGGVRCGRGDLDGGLNDYEQARELYAVLGLDEIWGQECLNVALCCRAFGRLERALALTEEARLCESHPKKESSARARLEHAASLLSLGDKSTADRLAGQVYAEAACGREQGLLLRANLVIAEVRRMSGNLQDAVQTLSASAAYIATGSANWLTAMYVRAFPGLLGVLAQALGADNIPLRMLLMIPIETIDAACVMESGLKGEDADVLRRRGGSELMRLAPEPASEVARTHGSSDPAHSCYVRLFGGLEVQTKDGLVDDARWRKRKARLVFAILVLRQRQDVPRDVLLEHLWPDMDEEHAKRNFYVTWSTMKRALACGGSPSAARQYVQCTGGVCRVTREVRSDVDDFDESIAALRAASSAGDMQGTLEAAQRLVGLYRGELLPGDLYEEWFADVRERTKHDFCDAMMCAATIAEGAGDSETALFLLRRAALADPWREDVYQSTMRCQMHAGQRSRAIETYMSCRSRLTEDLGIDPSVETTRIYQSVLAMEEADESLVQYAAE